MSSVRLTFDENDNDALYKWIDSYSITRLKKSINRDFADAVPLVEMLKKHFPKNVDMHNYTPSNSYERNLYNWRTLQRKVLSKHLQLFLPHHMLEMLAKAEVGAIEAVLWQIKLTLEKIEMIEKQKEENVYTLEGFPYNLNDDVTAIKIKQDGKIVDQRIVPARIYTEMLEQIKDQSETIQKLNDKVFHLEEMIVLKDSRIEDLRSKQNANKETKRYLKNLF